MADHQEVQDDFTKNIFRGLVDKARHHLQKSDEKLQEGASEQAKTHFGEASKIISQLNQSPQLWTSLTPLERNQYEVLQHKIETHEMSDNDWQLYKHLGNKSTGAEEQNF